MTIYFIEMEKSKFIKIGFTDKNPERRMSQLQTGQPDKLILLGTIKGDKVVERALHSEFAQFRLNGEWFSDKIREIVDHLIKKNGPWYYCREPEIMQKRMEAEWASIIQPNEIDKMFCVDEHQIKRAVQKVSGFHKAVKKMGYYPNDQKHGLYNILNGLSADEIAIGTYIASYSLG